MPSDAIDPPFESAWADGCEGCGDRTAPLDPADVDGVVMMLCERCYGEHEETLRVHT